MQLKNKVIMAAAGSGKTWGICNSVRHVSAYTSKKILITTYTNKGIDAVLSEYKKQNMGVIEKNVVVKTWFQFLLSDLIKPYQKCIVADYNVIRSIDFTHSYGYINYNKRGTKERYLNSNNDVLSNTVSELAVECNKSSKQKVIKRLEEVYSHIFIDEVQDLTGEDFTILEMLINSSIKVCYVGDYKQATYKTHNTIKNKSESGINIIKYFKMMEKNNKINLIYNSSSRRFNADICKFSNLIYPDSDNINTIMDEVTEHDGVYLVSKNDIELYFNKYKPTVLKYDIKTNTLGYDSYNFGQCKGLTFDRVLIFPNGPYKDFLYGKEFKDPSKYYVSATRAKYSIAFVVDKLFENDRFYRYCICINDKEICVSRYNGK